MIWLFIVCKKCEDKYGKKLINTETKTEIDAGKTTPEESCKETTEATGGLIGNKIADKIISVSKGNSKNELTSQRNLHTTPPKKCQQIYE